MHLDDSADAGLELGPDGAVRLDVVIEDGGHSGRGRLTVLRFAWSPADPLAVDLLLSAQPDHPALPRGSWIVLRDFLRYGLTEPTGDGDVRIRPDARHERVWLELERYGRPACVSVAADRVRAFLDRTEEQVPCGAERSAAALEELLDRLLQR
ncbi:MAG TPA: SsgA family sporulation/cell division regulator [Mycobacteriales bacterium]|nr:SsgA family sporulation/cell division regulator [Mycobacteriales bacterium]